jgi:hypothetical protein
MNDVACDLFQSRKTCLVEGHHCIFRGHPASGYPLGTNQDKEGCR